MKLYFYCTVYDGNNKLDCLIQLLSDRRLNYTQDKFLSEFFSYALPCKDSELLEKFENYLITFINKDVYFAEGR